MKTQPKAVPAKKALRKTSAKRGAAKRGAAKATTALLPAWVIGCYDGHSDGKLSGKKAYAR